MSTPEKLKQSRNLLLKLHKVMLDLERELYESINGRVSAGTFLQLLLDDAEFAWLRRFSTLIVEIDEMFDLTDGYSNEMVAASFEKVRQLVQMSDDDDVFNARYQRALQQSTEAAGLQSELRAILNS